MLRFSMMNSAPLVSRVRTLKSRCLLARAALWGWPARSAPAGTTCSDCGACGACSTMARYGARGSAASAVSKERRSSSCIRSYLERRSRQCYIHHSL